jgi:hypothetical protein
MMKGGIEEEVDDLVWSNLSNYTIMDFQDKCNKWLGKLHWFNYWGRVRAVKYYSDRKMVENGEIMEKLISIRDSIVDKDSRLSITPLIDHYRRLRAAYSDVNFAAILCEMQNV